MVCIYTPLSSSSALQVEKAEKGEQASILVQVGLSGEEEDDNSELAGREDIHRCSCIDRDRNEKEKKEEDSFRNDDVEGMELMLKKERNKDGEDVFAWIRRKGSSYSLHPAKEEKVDSSECAKVIHHYEKKKSERPTRDFVYEGRTNACLGVGVERCGDEPAKENRRDLDKLFFSRHILLSYPGRQHRDRKETTSLSSSLDSFLSSDKETACFSFCLSNIFHPSSSLASFSLQLPFKDLSFSFLSAKDTDLNPPCQDDVSSLLSFSLGEAFFLSSLSSVFCLSPDEERPIMKKNSRRGERRRSARRRRARRRSLEKLEWVCTPSSSFFYLSSEDRSDGENGKRLGERDSDEGRKRIFSSKPREEDFSFLLHGDEGVADSALLLSLLDRTDEEDILLESFASFLLAKSFSLLHLLQNLLRLEAAHPLHQFYLSA
ncbi:hypothetical protein CSUI_008764 [Cystoisospora suis]|uniref:Uncharacterized protein n=1 Tax=Cystoisospora suis TaxID=483139 RepID=A0A2C6KLP8_9APIC|nr:hypothetical protein CSUI_008764 [Cystoisospora suis]